MIQVGQRVILNTLMRKGDFPGAIVSIGDITGRCVVKLDCQDKPVTNVAYYDEKPTEVVGAFWQICWPDESGEDAEAKSQNGPVR